MKIGLLECDHVAERFRHIAGDYRQMFAALLDRYAPHFSLIPFDICNGQWPASLNTCDAYICTGSRFSVYDDLDWIHSLKNFVRRLHGADQPFVGICFGHQILADALGGTVGRSDYGWGVGIHEIEIERSEVWMEPQRSNFRLQFMHQDQVSRLPENGVLLGQSDHCPVSMFRVGDRMLGIQAHPEFTKAYSQALLLDRIDRIGAEVVRTALANLGRGTDEELTVNWIRKLLLANNKMV
jgi:GMP synthase-like glutamine amidotransferase